MNMLLHSNRFTKVKAFTILEMLIGLMVSSIIIAMIYLIYSNVSRQIIQYAAQQSELMEYNQFQSILSTDIKLSRRFVSIDPMHIQLTMDKEKIDYLFKKEYVVRRSSTQDTFNIQVKNLELSAGENIEDDYQTLKLSTVLLGQDIMIFEAKKVSLADQINTFFLK